MGCYWLGYFVKREFSPSYQYDFSWKKENRKHIGFIIEELNNIEEITGEKAINFVEKIKERLKERIEEQKWI